MGRDREDELAARPELPRNRGEGSPVVLDMLDNVESADQVVMPVGNFGEFRQRRAHHLAPQPLLRQRARFVVQFQPLDMAEARQHREVVTGAAADLEDMRVVRKLRFTADQVGDDLAPRAIPPVALVQFRHLLIDDALHQPNTH